MIIFLNNSDSTSLNKHVESQNSPNWHTIHEVELNSNPKLQPYTITWSWNLMIQKGHRYQEDLVGTFAQHGVVRAIHWSLARELGVKLTGVIGRLLPKQVGQWITWQVQSKRKLLCTRNTFKELPGKAWMEARLCEQGGHPSLCAGRMDGPWKQNSGLMTAEWQPKITDRVTGNRFMTLAFIKVSTWTSAASPGPAPSRSEAFLFSSFQKYRIKSDQSL